MPKYSSDYTSQAFGSMDDSTFSIIDSTDNSKKIAFDVNGTTGIKGTLATQFTTNKTISFPDATDTLIGKTTIDTLTNKNLSDATTFIVDSTDGTKKINIDVTGNTGITGTLQTSFTTTKTLILPDASDTLIGKNTTDILTNKNIASNTNKFGVISPSVDSATAINITKADGITSLLSVDTINSILNIINGNSRLVSTLNNNLFLGNLAGNTTMTGTNNIGFGKNSSNLSSGSDNVLIGNDAGSGLTTGYSNVFNGRNTGKNATTIRESVMVGMNAGANATTGNGQNTYVGYNAGNSHTTQVGQTYVGYNAGSNATTGTGGTFIGTSSGDHVTTGLNNTFVGYQSGHAVTTTNGSTAIGYQALLSSTGTGNIAIGNGSGGNITTGANNIIIGNTNAPTATGSNQLNIGDTIYGDTSNKNIGIGTFDLDGTPSVGRVVVKGSTNEGSTNIFVGRDSDEVNVFSINTDGGVTVGTTTPTNTTMLSLPASTTATSSVRLGTGVTPTTPVDGDIYKNSNKEIVVYHNAIENKVLTEAIVNISTNTNQNISAGYVYDITSSVFQGTLTLLDGTRTGQRVRILVSGSGYSDSVTFTITSSTAKINGVLGNNITNNRSFVEYSLVWSAINGWVLATSGSGF